MPKLPSKMRIGLPRSCLSGAVLLILLGAGLTPALGQEAAAPKPAAPAGINPAVVEKLVKYTIIAVDQGNATGNYSVLRELGTPKFQAMTSSAKLSDVFAPLRRMKLDMSAFTMMRPVFTAPPQVTNGQLKIVGYFPTAPIRINFVMTYAQQGGKVKLAGLAVTPSKVEAGAKPAQGNAENAGKADQQQ